MRLPAASMCRAGVPLAEMGLPWLVCRPGWSRLGAVIGRKYCRGMVCPPKFRVLSAGGTRSGGLLSCPPVVRFGGGKRKDPLGVPRFFFLTFWERRGSWCANA